MDWTRDELAFLRDTLARLYPMPNDSRRIVEDTGLDAARIAFDTKAIVNWFNIVQEARLHKDTIERLIVYAEREYPDDQRLKRLKARQPVAILEGPEPAAWRGTLSGAQLEAIISTRSSLVPISYLEQGLACSRAVGRVVRPDGGYGTGFLIANDRLVTNNHVLATAEMAAASVVQFNYQKTLDGVDAPYEEYRLKAEGFKTSSEDDWTMVSVDGHPVQKWGALCLGVAAPRINDRVTIVQHAGGGPKQISYVANVVVFSDALRLQYLTDTLPGSSGAPVFDREWKVVALHHSGGWIPEPGAPSKQPFYRNEGIAADRLAEAIREL